MSETWNEYIEELLPRYVEGKVTEEECIAVEAWMSASAENRRKVRDIRAVYLAADVLYLTPQIDTEKALRKVHSRMKGRLKVSWWQWGQRVAALLFLPLLCVYMIRLLNEPQPTVQWLEVRTNPGMTTSVVLPDSTVVWLNSESTLSYPSAFTGDRREVTLCGEGYFSVSSDASRQFVVQTSHDAQVWVSGTEFNVEAYPEDERIYTTLVSGEVGFVYPSAGRWKKVTMQPGQKISYTPASQHVHLAYTQVECDIAWKEGRLVFRNTPFPEVLRSLGKRYHVEFVVCNPALESYSFTGTFEHQRLSRILEYFRISSGIRFRYVHDEAADPSREREKIEIY
ncbi:MAG: DUF4974 domain-containing protein [Bacteroides sp.]|nr:DUF4974 domain-containing protein [Bacteroides sp.]